MKQLLTFTPIFTPGPAGQGTLDFSLFPSFDVNKVYAIIDITTNMPLYIPGAPNLGLVEVAGSLGPGGLNNSLLTLSVDTSMCDTSDSINIFYDTQAGYESNLASERGGMLQQIQENTAAILRELTIMNYILAEGFTMKREDVTQIRNDITNPSDTEYTGNATW